MVSWTWIESVLYIRFVELCQISSRSTSVGASTTISKDSYSEI